MCVKDYIMREIQFYVSKKYPLHYLACPYTHQDKEVMRNRFKTVTDAAVNLLNQGVYVFSPISYNAPWEEYDLPHTFSFWEQFDKSFIARMDSIIVLTIDGWKESVGVTEEIKFAEDLRIPVYYCTLEEIENGQLTKILAQRF